MLLPSRHVGVVIERPAVEVYDYVRAPANLPEWAPGLADSVREVDGRWVASSPMGSVVVTFVPRNDLGVLDHDVTLPSGESVTNPLRVLPVGSGCEIVFTVRPRPGQSREDFERDAEAVTRDLNRLKQIQENR